MIKGKQPGPPQLTFTDQMSINLGGKEVVAYHFAPCHTDGDTFVYFPAHKVLTTGDCFNTGNGQGVNLTGFVDLLVLYRLQPGGSFAGREKTADAALRLDFDTVVPSRTRYQPRRIREMAVSEITAIRSRITAMLREAQDQRRHKQDAWSVNSAGTRWAEPCKARSTG